MAPCKNSLTVIAKAGTVTLMAKRERERERERERALVNAAGIVATLIYGSRRTTF